MEPEKKTIVHVTKHFYPVWGGLERFIHGLITHLPEFNHRVICYNDDLSGNRNTLPAYFCYEGIEIYRIPCFKAAWFHSGFLKPDLLRTADLVHVHNMDLLLDLVLGVLAFQNGKIPVVTSTHGLVFHHSEGRAIKSAYLSLASKIRNKHISLVLATGKQDYDYLKKVVGKCPMNLFPNPLNIPEARLFPEKSQATGVLFISRLQASKRIDLVLEIFARLKGKGFSGPLTLILSGNDLDVNIFLRSHRKFISEINPEILINIDEEQKWRILADRKVFLNPSSWEGFGYSIFEALISNCITLVSPGVFSNFADYGFKNLHTVRQFDDTLSVAEKIMELCSNTFHPQFADEFRQSAITWKQAAHSISAWYSNLLQA